MKTHEEIKKGLECCVTRYNCHFDDEQCCYHSGGASCHYDVMKDALAYIKQLEEGIDRVYEQAKRLRQQFEAQSGTDMNVPRWISVEERLPEKHEDGSVSVVLVTDGYFIHMAYYDNAWYYCESGEMAEKMFYTVTHWMPLPKAPRRDDMRLIDADALCAYLNEWSRQLHAGTYRSDAVVMDVLTSIYEHIGNMPTIDA